MCKKCHSERIIRNGKVRGKPRFRCKDCGYNFIEGDLRVNEDLVVKRALAVILYALGKASFGLLAKIFDVSRSLTYRWIVQAAAHLPEPVVPGDIKEMEFDELWRFIGQKKTDSGSSRRWIVAQGEPSPGLSVIVILQPSGDSMRNSNS